MTEVIGVRFKKVGKVYYFDPCGIQVKNDAAVIVETARGQEYGEVAMANSQVEDSKIVQPLKKLVRVATEADKKTMEQNLQFEKDAFKVCEEKIQKHKLDMKLVSVEYTFDRSKILFYFSADGRVDFRELVKDLAGVFRTRIELRQIGVRDEAKMIGGLGICGRPLCCSAFLESFQPVSINMAKDQGLSLNPTKISGTCGRLMCCLKYENDAYQDLLKQTPPNESLVDTPYGRGTVMDTSLLRGTCRVRMMNSSDAPVTVPCDQCTVLRRGRDKGEPLDLPAPPIPQPQPKAESVSAEPETPKAEQSEPKPRRDRERRRPENRENRGERPQNHKPAERRDKPKSDKPENKPRPQQDKPKAQNDKPKKDKPQQEAKPVEGAQALKEGGDHKRRNHRGGRRNYRGGNKPQGGKPQAPKAE
ncbi:MAG: stage 0 sporulation family protein [Clostridia bacterium]|nr:stage 0 sporulation family protein [Clostridia bacterium]